MAQTSAAAIGAAPPSSASRPFAAGIAPQYLAAAVLFASGVVVESLLDKPSRAYVEGPRRGLRRYRRPGVRRLDRGGYPRVLLGRAYLGCYSDEDMAKGAGTLLGCKVKDFIEAKFDFVDKMLEWSSAPPRPRASSTSAAASAAPPPSGQAPRPQLEGAGHYSES